MEMNREELDAEIIRLMEQVTPKQRYQVLKKVLGEESLTALLQESDHQ